MSDKERIEELLHHFRMTQKEFAEKCGILPETIADIKREKHGISKKVSEKILNAFPEVNKVWLLTGEGDMLNNDLTITKLEPTSKTRHLIPLYNEVVSIGGTNDRIANMDEAGYVEEFIDTGSWFITATGAIRHYGDSMTEYQSGCILALKEVKERQLIIWGKDYVIETSEYRITKRIQRGKTDEYIRAYSSNEEKYQDGTLIHEPLDISWNNIHRIFLVLGYVVKTSEGTMVYNNPNKK